MHRDAMQVGEPSRTALGAARHRAAHQILDDGCIFKDPLAIRILGDDAQTIVRDVKNHPFGKRLRLFIAVRTRFAEDSLAASIARGVCQLVILGAGLDTYAYRTSLGGSLRIFEVDHPATQAWKRRRLVELAIAPPSGLTFAPADFERELLEDVLSAAGFDPAQQTFFFWLGVTPYLSEQAVYTTLGFIASLPEGAHVVFDYANPLTSGIDEGEDAAAGDALAACVASIGEPFLSYFETEQLHAKLLALGFHEIEDLGPPLIRHRYFPKWPGPVRETGGHVVRATTIPCRSP